MVRNAINNQDQDHQKEKDTTEVGHDPCKVHLTIIVKNAVNNQDQDHQKGKDTTEVGHNLCKVQSITSDGNKFFTGEFITQQRFVPIYNFDF